MESVNVRTYRGQKRNQKEQHRNQDRYRDWDENNIEAGTAVKPEFKDVVTDQDRVRSIE